MKITKSYLKQVIKEELEKLNEKMNINDKDAQRLFIDAVMTSTLLSNDANVENLNNFLLNKYGFSINEPELAEEAFNLIRRTKFPQAFKMIKALANQSANR